jgi:hypothetical protein
MSSLFPDPKTTSKPSAEVSCNDTPPLADLRPVERDLIVELNIRDILKDTLPPGVSGSIQVPSFAFMPTDRWAEVLREGLSKTTLIGEVYEVGVGVGVNAIYILAHHKGVTRMWASDLDENVAAVAERNVNAVSGIPNDKFRALEGSADLLSVFKERFGTKAPLNTIVACIPQVRLPAKGSTLTDKLAHYYSGPVPVGFEEIDHYDMTLNGRLLAQASEHLTPGEGRVILNLAGRVPLSVLQNMFNQTGYSCKVLHEAVIPQHQGTRLDDFIEQEDKLNIRFEFYDTPCCGQPNLSAKMAQLLIDAGTTVYHKLYVMEGTYYGN